MKVTAKSNYLHISPRKVRAVVNVVKKMDPRSALVQLKFIRNRAAEPMIKLIKSALANAENNFSLDTSNIKISEFKVDGGPMFKRFRPSSRGRVAPLKKRTSHVTLVLEGHRTAGAPKKLVPKNTSGPSTVPVGDQKTQKVERDVNREAVFKPKNIPVKKMGFVKKMFQRKSI